VTSWWDFSYGTDLAGELNNMVVDNETLRDHMAFMNMYNSSNVYVLGTYSVSPFYSSLYDLTLSKQVAEAFILGAVRVPLQAVQNNPIKLRTYMLDTDYPKALSGDFSSIREKIRVEAQIKKQDIDNIVKAYHQYQHLKVMSPQCIALVRYLTQLMLKVIPQALKQSTEHIRRSDPVKVNEILYKHCQAKICRAVKRADFGSTLLVALGSLSFINTFFFLLVKVFYFVCQRSKFPTPAPGIDGGKTVHLGDNSTDGANFHQAGELAALNDQHEDNRKSAVGWAYEF
jgi:hypothetical protein